MKGIQVSLNHVNYIERLLLENSDVPSVIICGDINFDFSCDTTHSNYMWDFDKRNHLVFSQLHAYTRCKATYTYSDMRNSKQFWSAIGHFIVRDKLFGCTQTV